MQLNGDSRRTVLLPTIQGDEYSSRNSYEMENRSGIAEDIVEYEEKDQKEKIIAALRFKAGPIFNLLNVIVGTGVLGLPYAMRQSGLWLGIILLIVVGLLTMWSYKLLLWSSYSTSNFSYETLTRYSMGDAGKVFVEIVIILDIMSSLSAYNVLIGQLFRDFLGTLVDDPNNPWLDLNLLIGLSQLLIVPMCLVKSIEWLGVASALSLLPLAYIMVLQVVYFAMQGGIVEPINMGGSAAGFFIALPIFTFAYSSQIGLFPIYNDMRRKGGTSGDISLVANWSVGLTGVIYLYSGILGILAYPDAAENVMENFPKNVATSILVVSMALSLILSVPVFIFPLRHSFDELVLSAWRKITRRGSQPETEPETEPESRGDEPLPETETFDYLSLDYVRFCVETIILLGIPVIVSIAIPSFITILGLSGAITKTFTCYVCPALFYLLGVDTPLRVDKRKWGALTLLVLGIVAGIISTVVIIQAYVEDLAQGSLPTNSTLSGNDTII